MGSQGEDGYVDGFNGKLSDELLDGGAIDTLPEAKVRSKREAGIEKWRGNPSREPTPENP